MGDVGTKFDGIGSWWGNDPVNKCEVEIDIMGTDGRGAALFGECKWTNKKADLDVLETLLDRARLFHFRNVLYYLFSKSGFTKGCREMAEARGDVVLVDFDSMF